MPRQPPPERRNEPVYKAPQMPKRHADSTKSFEGIEVGKPVNSKAGLNLEYPSRFSLAAPFHGACWASLALLYKVLVSMFARWTIN